LTTISNNTFIGPNQGEENGYNPLTLIQSSKIDADLIQIMNDLDYHLSVLQNIYAKLDTVETGATADLTAEEIAVLINASTVILNDANIASTIARLTDVASAVATHKSTTVANDMHPQTSIKNTGLTYSQTPVTLRTSCANLLDEMQNIRYQIHKINGKANWTDAPDSTITSLKSLLTSTTNSLNAHIEDLSKHLTSMQNAAIDGANAPSASNVFVTMNDIASLGGGDMLRSVYDPDGNGSVVKADAIVDGAGTKTYANIAAEIDADILAHKNVANAHHERYTNAEAINAINTDIDHGSTAQHNYRTDEEIQDVAAAMIRAGTNITKVYDDTAGTLTIAAVFPADDLTQTEVDNLRAGKLDDGTQPWIMPADDFTQTEVNNLKIGRLPALYETIATKTSNYAVSDSDFAILVDASTADITVTLPAASSSVGRVLNIKKIDNTTNALIIAGATIDGQATISVSKPYDSYTLVCNGTAWYII